MKNKSGNVTKEPADYIASTVGDDIPNDFECKKISVGGQEISVLKSESSVAFCGKKHGLLTLDVKKPEDIPLGVFTVVQ